jgi:hypothetical protein
MQAIGRSRAQILEDRGLSTLTHMVSIENLRSIWDIGLLSKNELVRRGIEYRDISDKDVQQRRANRTIELSCGDSRPLHDFVPLYLNAKNPMMSKRKEMVPELALLDILVADLLDVVPVAVLASGNATNTATSFSEKWWAGGDEVLEKIQWNWVLSDKYWNDCVQQCGQCPRCKENKRRAMAEILVAPSIANSLIHSIVVNSKTAEEAVQAAVGSELRTCGIICDQSRFF